MRKKKKGLLRRILVLCLVIAMLLTDASLAFAAEDPGTVTEAEAAEETAVTAEDSEVLQTEGPAEETPDGEAPTELPESDQTVEPAEEPVDTEEPAETPAADAEEPAEMPEEPEAGPEIPSETPAKAPVSNAGAADGTWHHIAVSFAVRTDGKRYLTVYIDGVQKGTANGTNFDVKTLPMFIGCNLRFTNGAWAPENINVGQMDDYLYYNRALSAEEIATLASYR